MKKFYRKAFLLLSLLMGTTMGAQAQLTLPETSTSDNPKYYLIKNYRSGRYAAWDSENNKLVQVTEPTNASQWYFIGSQSGDSILEVSLGNATTTGTGYLLASTTSMTETGATWYIKANPHNEYGFCVSLNSNLSSNCWDDQGNHASIGYWQPSSGDNLGTTWVFSPIEGSLELTSLKQEAEDLLALENTSGTYLGGYSSSDLAALKSAYESATAANTTDLSNAIDAVKALPLFAFSNTKAYTIYCKSSSKGAVTIVNGVTKTAALDASNDAFKWAIVTTDKGTQYLLNVGTKQLLYCPGETNSQNWTPTFANPSEFDFGLMSITDGVPYAYVGLAGKTSDLSSLIYFMHSNNGNEIVSWTANADNSQFYIQEAGELDTDMQAIVNEVLDGNFAAAAKPGYLASIESTHKAFVDYGVDASSPYVGSPIASDETIYNTAVSAVNAATTVDNMAAAVTTYTTGLEGLLKKLDTDKYYVIESALNFDDGETKALYESSDEEEKYIKWKSLDGDAATMLWKFAAATDEGTYNIQAVNTSNYISAASFLTPVYTTDLASAGAYVLAPQAVGSSAMDLRCPISATDWATTMAYVNGSTAANASSTEGTRVMSYKDYSGSTAIYWKLREVSTIDVTIDALGYVTRTFPFAVDLTAAKANGLQVFAISSAAGTQATLAEFTGDVLAANQPVVLYAPTADAYTLTISSEAGEAPATNILTSTLVNTTLDASTAYVLAANEAQDGVEFALLSDAEAADGGNVVPANRAYLAATSATSGQTLSFTFGTPTAIESATVESDEDVTWYTLGGVAVQNPSKGIYVNSKGKVVLFK